MINLIIGLSLVLTFGFMLLADINHNRRNK